MLIVGGLLAPPMAYRPLRRRLLARGAASVDIAPVNALAWAWAGMRGFTRLQGTVAQAITRAYERGGAWPILVIGHSGGGLLARLAMCDVPYRGRIGGAAPMVGCLVTLGSPHDLHLAPLRRSHEGVRLAAFLAEHSPGSRHAPRTRYVTVGSDVAAPGPQRGGHGNPLVSLLGRFFLRITGPTLPPGGDGIVSERLSHLDGARRVTLHDAFHGVIGSPWYGDDAIVDAWWPIAAATWREAVG